MADAACPGPQGSRINLAFKGVLRAGEPSEGVSGRGDDGVESDLGDNVGELVAESSDFGSSLFLFALEAPEAEVGEVGRSVGEA